VRYAQEARSYALLCLLGALACDIALRLTRYGGSARRYALLGIFCAAALLTHFFIIGGIACIALFALLTLRGRPRVATICVIVVALSIALWELPIMSHMIATQNQRGGLGWLIEPRAGLLGRTLLRVAALPAAFLIQPNDASNIAGTLSIVLLVLPLFLNKRRQGLLLAGLWPIGIIGVVAASDLWLGHGALEYLRYTLAASPMVFVGFATIADLGADWMRQALPTLAWAGCWIRHSLPALAVAGALLAMPQVYDDQFWQKTEARALAQDVHSHVAPGDVLVIISQPDMGFYAAGQEYLSLDFYAGPMPCATAILESPASDAVRRSIWSHQRVWLVIAFYGADAAAYLGPCRLTPAATTRYHSGRLYRAQSLN
jgi:hypothetical protein